VSKERARRRAEREQARAERQAAVERARLQSARRRDARDAVRARLRPGVRRRGQQGILARRRRAENAVILGLFVVAQMFIWLFTDDIWWRALGALVALFSVPVLVTLVLDRRG